MTYEEVKKLLDESEKWRKREYSYGIGFERVGDRNVSILLTEDKIRLVVCSNKARCATSCKIEELQEYKRDRFLYYSRHDDDESVMLFNSRFQIWL